MAGIPVGLQQTIRNTVESFMVDMVVIEKLGARIDLPSGGWEYSAGTTVTTKGLIGPLSKTAIEQLQAGKMEYAGLEELRIPDSVAVTGRDKITVTSTRHGTTKRYEVEGVTPKGTYAVSQALIVKAVGQT